MCDDIFLKRRAKMKIMLFIRMVIILYYHCEHFLVDNIFFSEINYQLTLLPTLLNILTAFLRDKSFSVINDPELNEYRHKSPAKSYEGYKDGGQSSLISLVQYWTIFHCFTLSLKALLHMLSEFFQSSVSRSKDDIQLWKFEQNDTSIWS